MRLDVFLKLSRLIIRRPLAKKFTNAGLIAVNGVTQKASYDVKIGDEIEIRKHNHIKVVKVLTIPSKKQLSKKDSGFLFEIISEEKIEDELC